jgi:antitoxin component YwqK of YwqJK toxin-antitoxin module
MLKSLIYSTLLVVGVSLSVCTSQSNAQYASYYFDSWSSSLPVTPGGIHYKPKCPGSQNTAVDGEVDSTGTGYYNLYDCQTGNLTLGRNFVNWKLNGSFQMSTPNYPTLAATGQFSNGVPSGTWTFKTGPKNLTITSTITNGTGLWAIPEYCPPNPPVPAHVVYAELGQLKNGLKEGLWTNSGCGGIPTEVGQYVDGNREGIWRANPVGVRFRLIVTYHDDMADGPFVEWPDSTDRRIEGEFRSGDASAPAAPANFDPFMFVQCPQCTGLPGRAQLWGTWRFLGLQGEVIGENDLKDGNGLFSIWHENGAVAAEGTVVHGKPEGDWTLYGWDFRPTSKVTFKQGVVVGTVPIPPLAPPLPNP